MSLAQIVNQNIKKGMNELGQKSQYQDCYNCGYSGCVHDRGMKSHIDNNVYLEGNMKVSNSTPNTVVLSEKLYDDGQIQITNSYVHHDGGIGRVDPLNDKVKPFNMNDWNPLK